MGSMQNTRILRFLIVLAMVILTIFIYASYSTIATLTPSPPHMRTAGPALPLHSHASALVSTLNRTTASSAADSNVMEKFEMTGNGWNSRVHSKRLQQEHAISTAAHTGVIAAPAKRHRVPTIDADAGGSDGNALLEDVPDEAALARFVNNDLLEEQYVQNVDSTLGNTNNTASAIDTTSVQFQQQLQKQQKQQPEQIQPDKQQQQQQNQLVDNNLNKILDSDVLIPTSNLQKFIENADKILKNITVGTAAIVPPVAGAAAAVNKDTEEKSVIPQKSVDQLQKQKSESDSKHDIVVANAADDDDADDDAQPPSVVMQIKRVAAVASAGAPSTTKADNVINNKSSAKEVSSSTNVTKTGYHNVDPTQGIPTQQIYESGHMNDELNLNKLCPNQGADLKLIILITSAQAHAEARLSIRQTWGHYGIRRDVSTAFVLGRSTNETLNLALTQENYIYGDLIRGNFIDSYNNLTLKTVSALEWVDKHCARVKYVLKTDDDMFINVPKLLTFLDNHAKEKRVIYGRLANKWKPIRNKKSKYYVSTGQFSAPVFPPFTTGPAYVMTADIVHELHIRSLHQVYLKLEDVFTTGIVAQQLGIKRVHVNEFLNRRIAFNPCNIRKTISVHMIKANEQFDLWKKLLDQTTKCK